MAKFDVEIMFQIDVDENQIQTPLWYVEKLCEDIEELIGKSNGEPPDCRIEELEF